MRGDTDTLLHLRQLADVRDACLVRPRWPGAIARYWSAVEQSPLRARLQWSEIDDLVSRYGTSSIAPVSGRGRMA